MSRVRELLVAMSKFGSGEMVSYVVTNADKTYCGIDFSIVKIQSRSRSGAIVLIFDYINKQCEGIDLYERVDRDMDKFVMTESEKLDFAITYVFEKRNNKLHLELEKDKIVVLSEK